MEASSVTAILFPVCVLAMGFSAILIPLLAWLLSRSNTHLKDLVKIIAELRERHPDDESFSPAHKKNPGDPPELTRFRARTAAGTVFEITVDGSRATAERVHHDK